MADPGPSPATLRNRFRGALLGTAIGDALGAPFEGSPLVHEDALAAWAHANEPLRWTDDTHMTIGVAESLIARGGFDGAHMAERFVANYDAEPWRGYGAGPPIVFNGIRAGANWDQPAATEPRCASHPSGCSRGATWRRSLALHGILRGSPTPMSSPWTPRPSRPVLSRGS
jgi:poly(ADP-ribose) glycohydrolase ARH3